MVAAMSEPSLFHEEEETVREAELLLASGAPPDSSWPSHYRNLLDKYRKLLSQSLRLMKIGDLMQNELNRLNEEVRRAKEEWERTFDTVPDPIMILDEQYRIVQTNKATLDRLGLPLEQVVGAYCFTHFHGTDVPPSYCPHAQLLSDGKPHTEEVCDPRLGGTFVVSVSPILDRDGHVRGTVHVAHDITERKAAEDQVKASLKEKEILLREIHHRVKNNFQMIAGLLILQADQVGDAESRADLKEAEARIRAMARVHEKLYQSDLLGEIRMDEYLSELAADLICFRESTGVTIVLKPHMEPITFDIDTAIPCGMILTELVTNAMRHAFPKGAEGTVEIGLRKIAGQGYELVVRDDGMGLPEGFTLEANASLGLKLVQAFAKRFHGTIALERERGTGVRIGFEWG